MANVKLVKKPSYIKTITNIQHGMLDRNINQRELSELTGIKISTLYNRFKNPKGFRLEELAIISKVLGLTIEDLVRGLIWK